MNERLRSVFGKIAGMVRVTTRLSLPSPLTRLTVRRRFVSVSEPLYRMVAWARKSPVCFRSSARNSGSVSCVRVSSDRMGLKVMLKSPSVAAARAAWADTTARPAAAFGSSARTAIG